MVVRGPAGWGFGSGDSVVFLDKILYFHYATLHPMYTSELFGKSARDNLL